MTRVFFFALFVLAFFTGCTQTKNVSFDNENITYEGRILYKPDAAVFSWSGTSATIRFQGTDVSATLQDLDTANYYNVIVDNQVVSKIHTEMEKKTYLLASGLPYGEHVVQIFKRTEWDKGKTLFYGFDFPAGAKVLDPFPPKERKIEFFGNSITSGYGNEDYSGKDRGNGYFQNNYLTYAAITARHFNAQYHCTSKSGIGILISWFPFIMKDIYDRTDPVDSTSKWDFNNYIPDVVVINLFQNDSWLVERPQYSEFKRLFGTEKPGEDVIIASYKETVSLLRGVYPGASIICALGSMDATREGSPWPGYIQEAVNQLNDPKIYTHFFPFKNTGGHPNIEEQEVMANSLISFIEENINW